MFALLSAGLAYPFSAGLVAAFNPCGFAMLPTYLAFFVGQEGTDERASAFQRLSRAVVVGLTLTAGFVLVFGVLGIITRTLLSVGDIARFLPWLTIAIGILLVPVGIAMLFGYEPTMSVPRLQAGGKSRQLTSVFLFGVSYAIVSFGCTAPLIISATASSFTNDGFLEGIATFLAYAAGMSSVVVFLTVAAAMAQTTVAGSMRRILPYVHKVSGVLLIVGGIYVASYGWYEVQLFGDPDAVPETSFLQRWLESFQAGASSWISSVGAGRLGLIVVVIVALLGAVTYLVGGHRSARPPRS